MNEKNIVTSGILWAIKPLDIPENLRNFLTSDGMDGIEDLELMLKDPKLFKRIPQNVREEYEVVYTLLSLEIDEHLDSLEQRIKEMRSSSKFIIHEAIQSSLDSTP